jgi:flagellar basal-body rod modification protein FlgD
MSVAAVSADSTATTPSSVAGTSAQDLTTTFLTLLTTQMQNQDPLNPMDNAEVTSQMAQLSTVEGINNLNTNLASFVNSSQALQAGNLVGHSVLGEGDVLQLTGAGSGTVGVVNLASAADTVQVQVMNPSGTVVRNISLGSQSAGLVNFSWDGLDDSGNQLAAGNYTFSATASSAGKTVATTTYGLGTVNSVVLGSTGLTAQVSNLGSLSLSQILQIF